MFLPIADSPNPRGTPFATWGLIAANVAMYLLLNIPLGSQRADVRDPAFREYLQFLTQTAGERGIDIRQAVGRISAYDLFVFKHGYRPSEPRITDLFFSMFLHGSFMHIFGNMLFLWIYGDNVERRLGAIPYVFWYLVTGAAATLFHGLIFSTSGVPLVGASGAISGVLGFYFVFFPKNVVKVLFFLPPFIFQTFSIPARIVLGAYLLIDNLLPFLFAGEGGVAHGAHIGGFLAGGAVAWLMVRRGLERRPRGIEAPERAPSGASSIRAALAEGRYAEAANEYFALSAPAAHGALAAPEAVSLATWLRGHGHSDAALLLLRRVVRDVPRGEGLADANALAGAILLEDMGEPIAAYQYLLSALEMKPDARTQAEIRGQLAAIEAMQKRKVPNPRHDPGW
jgi:membrane associated rhomboid family serine protease